MAKKVFKLLLVCLLVAPSLLGGIGYRQLEAQSLRQQGLMLRPFKFDTQAPPNYSAGSIGDGFVAYVPASAQFRATSHVRGTAHQSIVGYANAEQLDIAINANFYIDLSTGVSPGCLGFCGSTGQVVANKSSSSSRYAFITHQDADLTAFGSRIIARESRVAILNYADVMANQVELNSIAAKLNANPKVEAVVSGNSLGVLNGVYQSQTELFAGMNDPSSQTLIGYTSTGEIVFAVFKTATFNSRIKSFLQNSTPQIIHAVMLDGGSSSQLFYRPGINTLEGLSGYTADSFNRQHNLSSTGETVPSGTTGLEGSPAASQVYAPLFGRSGRQGLRNVPAYIGAVLPSAVSQTPVSSPIEPPASPPALPPTTPPVLSTTSSYTLSPGWNAIALNVSVPDIAKASDLAGALTAAGAEVEVISRMESSTYKSFIPIAEGEDIGDFNLVEGEGLFIKLKNITPVEFELTGEPIPALKSVSTAESGIRFLGNIQGGAQQFARQSAEQVTQVSSYEQGQFSSIIFAEELVFGNDFQLVPTKGYFVVVKSR